MKLSRCHKCMLERFVVNAGQKAEEWRDTPAIARTHLRRQHEMEIEAVSAKHADDCAKRPALES